MAAAACTGRPSSGGGHGGRGAAGGRCCPRGGGDRRELEAGRKRQAVGAGGSPDTDNTGGRWGWGSEEGKESQRRRHNGCLRSPVGRD